MAILEALKMQTLFFVSPLVIRSDHQSLRHIQDKILIEGVYNKNFYFFQNGGIALASASK
jgi:hypothetical protein